jgi:hypothetical protein
MRLSMRLFEGISWSLCICSGKTICVEIGSQIQGGYHQVWNGTVSMNLRRQSRNCPFGWREMPPRCFLCDRNATFEFLWRLWTRLLSTAGQLRCFRRVVQSWSFEHSDRAGIDGTYLGFQAGDASSYVSSVFFDWLVSWSSQVLCGFLKVLVTEGEAGVLVLGKTLLARCLAFSFNSSSWAALFVGRGRILVTPPLGFYWERRW